MKKLLAILIVILLLCEVITLFPIPKASASTQKNYVLNLNLENSVVATGDNLNFTVYGNCSTAQIMLTGPDLTQLSFGSWSTNISHLISVNASFNYGIYKIQAINGSFVATSYFTVLNLGSWSATTLPYSKTWKNVAYTFYANGTILAVKNGDVLNVDLSMIRGLISTYSITASVYYNSQNLLIRLSKGSVAVDLSFSFVYEGLKFNINGTLDQQRNFTFSLANIKQLTNKLQVGDLIFDYSDLLKNSQVFTVSNGLVTVVIPKTFSIDPVIYSNGFESGDFSGFDSVTGTPSIVTSPVHSGTYAAKIVDNEYYGIGSYCTKSFTPTSNIYASFSFQISSLPSQDQGLKLFDINNGVFDLGYYNYGGRYLSLIILALDSELHEFSYSIDLGVNTWYTVELEYDDVSHIHNVWLNGVSIIQTSSLTVGGDVSVANVGVYGDLAWGATTVTIDDFVLDSTGVRSSSPTYSNLGVSSTVGNSSCVLSSYWEDSANTLANYTFQTNVTGTAVNSTSSFSATPGWANKTVSLPAFGTVQWRVWANDNYGNWANTGLQNFTVTSIFNVTSSVMNGTRFNPNAKINVSGLIKYSGTSIAVTSGPTIYVARTFNLSDVLGSTSTLNSTGGFNITGTLPSYVGSYNYTIYTSGLCGQNKTILPIVDAITVSISTNTTIPVSNEYILGNITATYQYDSTHIPYAALTMDVARNGTASYATGNFTDHQTSGTTENYTISSISESTYGLNTIYSKNTATVTWGSTANPPTILIPQIIQTVSRTGINQNVLLSYQVQYGNGTTCNSGTLTVNGVAISVSAGWANFTSTASAVGVSNYVLSAVNCSGIVAFSQVPSNPSVIFDNLQVSFSASNNTPLNNENVTISWFVLHQYDGTFCTNYVGNITRDSLPWQNLTSAFSAVDSGNEVAHTYSAQAVTDGVYGSTSFSATPLTLTWHVVPTSSGGGGGGGGNTNFPTATPTQAPNNYPTETPTEEQSALSSGALYGIIIIVAILLVATVVQQESSKRKSTKYALQGKNKPIWRD